MSIEFKLSNTGIQRMTTSQWECRNIGLEKILNGAYPYIMKEIVDIKKPIKIIIQTHDFPYPITKKDKYTIELQTISETFIEDLFPDYVHGNWWHIGLTDFDEFTKDIVTSCLSNDPIYNKIFWAGSVQNIPQRQKYKSISYSHPNKFETFTMSWRGNSKPSKFIKLRDQWQWDILIDLTGHGWSGRLKLLPYCHRPLIITDRKFWSWSDFKILKTKNFYKVKKDLSNLLEIFEYINNNMEEAKSKVIKLYNYVSEEFKFENVCKVAAQIIVNKINSIDK